LPFFAAGIDQKSKHKMAKTTLHCSFCGRSRDEVKILIAGQEGHICENCVEHAREIIDQELLVKNENASPTNFKLNVKKSLSTAT
jgi:ATP-dependent Clp protease ATP-binding subunit ClpX